MGASGFATPACVAGCVVLGRAVLLVVVVIEFVSIVVETDWLIP